MLRNVVIIITDQQRADMCARRGFPVDTTPTCDSVASAGAWFRNAFTSMPLCSPARTSLLTGRFPSAHRVRENYGLEGALFEDDLFSLAARGGLRTGLFGKNHTYLDAGRVDCWREYSHDGAREARNQEEREFDQWLKGLHHRTALEPAPGGVSVQLPYRIVSDAIEWVEQLVDDPFCMLLSFPEPHNPYQVCEPYSSLWDLGDIPPAPGAARESLGWLGEYLHEIGQGAFHDYDEVIPQARRNYCGMLRLIDDQVGRFLSALEQSGLRDSTLVVMCSDHGDYMGQYGLVRKGVGMSNCLVEIPLVFSGCGISDEQGERSECVSIVDVLPTICEAFSWEIPQGVQGRSLWPLLRGGAEWKDEFRWGYAELGVGGLPYDRASVPPERPGLDEERVAAVGFDELNAVTQGGRWRMVSDGRWKLVMDVLGNGRVYDLEDDPTETRGWTLGSQNHEVEAALLRALSVWSLRVEDPLAVPANGYIRRRPLHNWVWA